MRIEQPDYVTLSHKQEPLLRNLAAWQRQVPRLGAVLQHPLYYSVPHYEALNAVANACYLAKSRLVRYARRLGDFDAYILHHERAWRLQAFLTYTRHNRVPNDQWWEKLADVWIDSENVGQNAAAWTRLLSSGKSDRCRFMSHEERAEFRMLPTTIHVYRGYKGSGRSALGHDWSLSLKTATWFAKRFDGKGKVAEATISKKNVVGLLLRRGESEIVAAHYLDAKIINSDAPLAKGEPS